MRQCPAPVALGLGFGRFILLKAVKLVLEALARVEGLMAENQVVKVTGWSGYDELARDEFDGQAQLIPTGKEIADFVESSFAALQEEEEG